MARAWHRQSQLPRGLIVFAEGHELQMALAPHNLETDVFFLGDALVARQAIFDRDLRVVGYELLFRRSEADQTAIFRDRDRASASVILKTFLDFGLEQIVGQTTAFLNLTRSFFLTAQSVPFPRERVVLELLEGQLVDAALIDAVRSYAQRGYRIALDDFVYQPEFAPLLEIADIVKIDVLSMSPSRLEEQLKVLAPYELKLLAEKVETPEHYEYCRDLGFDLFQGFFLCRPNVVQKDRVPAHRLATLRRLARLQNPRAELEQLEDVLAQDPSLREKLLRLINATVAPASSRMESVRQTIVLLGIQQVRSWMSLLTVSSLADKPDELLLTAMVRAKMCERLATITRQTNADSYFTVGLFSTVDALLDLPMVHILDSLPLHEDVREGLLNRQGPIGVALECVLAYERGDWEAVRFLQLPLYSIRKAYLDALDWAYGAAGEIGIGGQHPEPN